MICEKRGDGLPFRKDDEMMRAQLLVTGKRIVSNVTESCCCS